MTLKRITLTLSVFAIALIASGFYWAAETTAGYSLSSEGNQASFTCNHVHKGFYIAISNMTCTITKSGAGTVQCSNPSDTGITHYPELSCATGLTSVGCSEHFPDFAYRAVADANGSHSDGFPDIGYADGQCAYGDVVVQG